MKKDAFSAFHPLVNFVFFVLAIGFGVVIQHPAYLAVGFLASGVYYLLLHRGKGIRMILGLIPLFLVMSLINPIFNTRGQQVLFTYFSRPYTLEALYHGMAVAAVFVVMFLWFGCYSAVLTSDKFVCLFGGLIPSLSLLLVMVLRMIPNLIKKARQILGARRGIGKGAGDNASAKEKLHHSALVLSALTDWALEGSIVTADSMRSRGYGTARRTSFHLWKMQKADWQILLLQILLAVLTVLPGGTAAAYTPALSIAFPTWGLAFYSILLFLPSILHAKEVLAWRFFISKI